MKLIPSTEQDITTLTQWIQNDPYHKDYLDPLWWLTGADGTLLAFCLTDDQGAICFVRLDEKNDNTIRLHCQFAPRDQVSKIRLLKGMLKCIPVVQSFCRNEGASGIVFQSVNPLLIDFMKRKFGFEHVSQNDYLWQAGI